MQFVNRLLTVVLSPTSIAEKSAILPGTIFICSAQFSFKGIIPDTGHLKSIVSGRLQISLKSSKLVSSLTAR